MNIAIIGTGNVGGTLAMSLAKANYSILLGVRNTSDFKGKETLVHPNISVETVANAVKNSEVILLATPAMQAVNVAKSLGDTTGKIIIDTMNIVRGMGPEGYSNTADAILDHTNTKDVVKCFNTTGFNNMDNPKYADQLLDNFVAGDSDKAKQIAMELSKAVGFEHCYDIGGNENFMLIEQFALFWINLALFQGQGREIGFKLLKR